MESLYHDSEIPLADDGLVATKIECKPCGSLFYEVSVIRNIDRYLRLDDLHVMLVPGACDGIRVVDASEVLNGRHSLMTGIDFVEGRMSSIAMFEMYGLWHEQVSVLVVHVRNRPFLSVVVPIETPVRVRRRIAMDVRHGLRLGVP